MVTAGLQITLPTTAKTQKGDVENFMYPNSSEIVGSPSEIKGDDTRASFNYQQDTTIPYRWEEPLQGATRIAFSYDGWGSANIGFDFDFYDSTYSSINLFTHGYASFESTVCDDFNLQFPTANSDYRKVISPAWEYVYYWSATPNSGIYYKTLSNPDRFVATWYKTPFDWNGALSDFQMILYKDSGNILFNYKTLGGASGLTVGLNDGDGVHFNMPYYSNPIPQSMQSIIFGIMGNDVGVETLISPVPNTRVRPNSDIIINASIINYGFNNQNNVPVSLTITSNNYDYTDTSATTRQMSVMGSSIVSFHWTVPDIEDRDYTITLETTMGNDEVSDGNTKEFTIRGETFYDIGVWDVNRIKGQWYPLMTIPVTVQMANWGNIDANMTVTMEDGRGYSMIKEVQTIESGEIEGVIESEIENVTFHWMPPAVGDYRLTFTAFLAEDEYAPNNVGYIDKDIYPSPFDIRLGHNGTIMKSPPGNAISITFTVYNDGEKKDDIQLNVTEYPSEEEGWTIPLFDHDVLNSLDKESSRKVSMIVAVPASAMAGIKMIKILAASKGDGVTNASLELPIEVLPDPKVEVIAPESSAARPGEFVIYNFTIRNIGNAVDSFSISLKSSNHWETRLLAYSVTPELVPFTDDDNVTVQVKITVPEDALYGSTDILTVTASSMENINIQSSTHIATAVLQKFDIDIKARVLEYNIHTERDVWISFNVTNTGNGDDDTIEFNVSHPYGWKTYVDDSKLHGGLPRLYWGQIFLKVWVPRGTPNDVFPVVVTVLAGKTLEAKDTFTFYFQILPEFGVNITSVKNLQQADNGDMVIYDIAIKNTGNTYEAFNISSGSPHISFQYLNNPLQDLWLDANESAMIKAFLTVPMHWGADSNNTTKDLDPYSFKIMVGYSINPLPISDQTEILLQINPRYEHSILTETKVVEIARKNEGISKDYYLTIENMGNTQDIIYLNLEKASDGPISAVIRTKNLLLSYEESKQVVMTINAENNAALGEYALLLKTTSNGDPSKTKLLNISVPVVDYDFIVDSLTIRNETFSQGEEITLNYNEKTRFMAAIKNTGSEEFEGLAGENLTVSFFLGKTLVYTAELNSIDTQNSKIISFTRELNIYGERTFYVRINEEGIIPETDETNNVFSLKVNIVSPYSNRGRDDKGSEISDGALIFGIILIIVLLSIVVIIFTLIVKKSRYREGYDEEGRYRPDLEVDDATELKIHLDEWGGLSKDETLSIEPAQKSLTDQSADPIPQIGSEQGSPFFPETQPDMPQQHTVLSEEVHQPEPQMTKTVEALDTTGDGKGTALLPPEPLPENDMNLEEPIDGGKMPSEPEIPKPMTKPIAPITTNKDIFQETTPEPQVITESPKVATTRPVSTAPATTTTKPKSAPSMRPVITKRVTTRPLSPGKTTTTKKVTTRPVITKAVTTKPVIDESSDDKIKIATTLPVE